MKFFKNIELILLILILIIIFTIILGKLNNITTLSPKTTPKCILNGAEIKANPKCTHEQDLIKDSCGANIKFIGAACQYA